MVKRSNNGQFARVSDVRQKNKAEEECIQRTFVQQFKMHGGLCEGFSIPNEGAGGGKAARNRTIRLKAMGLRPGAADYAVFWPVDDLVALHFIEFKSKTGQWAATQKSFCDDALSANANYSLCRSWQDAWFALQNAGAPLARILTAGNVPKLQPNPNYTPRASTLVLRGQIT